MYDVQAVDGTKRISALTGKLFAGLLLAACGGAEEADVDDALASSSSSEMFDAGLASDATTGVGDADDGGSADGGGLTDAGVDAGAPRDLSEPFIDEVIANGTGCQAGTWAVQLTPGGEARVAFDSFVATVGPEQSVSVKNCQLTISMGGASGRQYAVESFAVDGQTYLERGVTARLISQFYFQGNPVASQQLREELRGPIDDGFTFQGQVPSQDVLWSPCGLDRKLNINTSISLTGSRGVQGFVKATQAVVLKLRSRACPHQSAD